MLNNQEKNDSNNIIEMAKQNMMKQAGMAGLAVLVTIVLVFAMSVAWYSNVIHTEGLVFETASWDFSFEGSVIVGDKTWKIAPGDSGIVPLEIKNSSEEPITVLANVTKDGFPSYVLKERIYFYVDVNEEVNGELVDRIYINETDEYGYRLLSGETLTLNETYHSHPYLKWEWVYDVLGYYVMGTMDEEGVMSIDDYMRPVIYDYDKATFDKDGNLLTVNGGMSREDFLKELYATDGYQGSYPEDGSLEEQSGYYPVMVDEKTGQGIWLHLNSAGEILADTQMDTKLATAEEAVTFEAKLLLSGQQSESVTVQVADQTELAEQLNAGNDKVTLTGDLTVDSEIEISAEGLTVLDLAGNTLTFANKNSQISLSEGSTLIVQNGDVVGGSGSVFETTGASLTLNDVEISETTIAVQVRDNNGTGLDSRIKISDCNIAADQAGVMVRGNGDASARKTYLLIENSTIDAGWYAVLGNGSMAGTEFEILGSNLKGGYAGIYQPQADSITTISNSTIEGETGIGLKGGTLKIKDGTTVLGTGAKVEPAFDNSGFTGTGDAVYIETNYNKEIKLFVSGANTLLKSTNSYAIQVYEPDAEQVTVSVSGGVFSSDISAFLAEGYVCKELADHTFTVGEQPASETQE